MGMGVLFFLLLGWHTALAHVAERVDDYILLQFGNNTYVNKTMDELKQMIGVDPDHLTPYQCDGNVEYQLLTDLVQSNPQSDSFVVEAQQNGHQIFLKIKDGKLQTEQGTVMRWNEDPWINAVISSLKKITATPEGRALVSALEHARNPIVLKKGVNRFSPQEYGGRQYFGLSMATALMLFNTQYLSSEMPLYQIGIGGVLYWDPFGSYSRIESDGKLRPIDPFISLAHEMYHAYDSIRGMLDTRFVRGEAYEMAQMGEYRAVFFEDVIRKAYGKLPVKYYSESNPATANGKPSMLDEHGMPRVMPAPCLRGVH